MFKKLQVYKGHLGNRWFFYIIFDNLVVFVGYEGFESKWSMSVTQYIPSTWDGNCPQSSLLELLVITGVTQHQILEKIEQYQNLQIERVAKWKK